ncbi:hypothetical protein FQA47_018259 [Oryzias melastigma]|uniref:Ig-like domain-containing protein n=1 Tax=Oryzias melastigma TaxID=30732 RepID=A0A834FRZ3_ORYME|nr:hypothetical protein FQA47_018259 [Oryzias melastigma]
MTLTAAATTFVVFLLCLTDLQVQIQTKTWYSGGRCLLEMSCSSRCVLPPSSFVWYKNGRIITGRTQQKYSAILNTDDSVSCAVGGHESFHAPVVCVYEDSCNKVSYSKRNICTFRGSSVTIYCSVQSQYSSSSDYWISVRGQQTFTEISSSCNDHICCFTFCLYPYLPLDQVNMSPDINGPSAEAAEEQLELHYSSINFSNIRRNHKPRQSPEDNTVEYSAVVFKKSAEDKK